MRDHGLLSSDDGEIPTKETRMRRYVGLALLSLAVAAVIYSPALYRLSNTGYGDWQYFQQQWEAGYVALIRFREFPVWNPYHCGGVFLFGDPQAQVYGPLFYLFLPLGPTLGLKAFLITHCALGLAGMYLFARHELTCRAVPAALAAAIWCGSGFFAWHMSGGHSAFLPYFFTPALLLSFRKSAQDPRYAAAVALIMALTLFEGGVYPFPSFCLLLTFDALVSMLQRGRVVGTLRAGLLAVPLIALMGAFRLWPTFNTLRHYPRPTYADDAISLREVLEMLTARTHAYRFGHEYVWAEYGSFIGWGALALGCLGVVFAMRAKRYGLVAGACLFFLLMTGAVTPYHPWSLIHHLPVFDSLRVPSRFAVLFTFFLALLAAESTQALTTVLSSKLGIRVATGAVTIVLIAVISELALGNASTLNRWMGPILPDHITTEVPYHLLPASQYGQYSSFPRRGVSSRGCYTGMTYRAAKGLWEGRQPQARMDGTGEVLSVSHTSRTIRVSMRSAAASTLTFNQTYADGWQANTGPVLEDAQGRLSVVAPAGQREVVLRYEPPELWPSALLSLLGLILCGMLASWGTAERFAALAQRLGWTSKRS